MSLTNSVTSRASLLSGMTTPATELGSALVTDEGATVIACSFENRCCAAGRYSAAARCCTLPGAGVGSRTQNQRYGTVKPRRTRRPAGPPHTAGLLRKDQPLLPARWSAPGLPLA